MMGFHKRDNCTRANYTSLRTCFSSGDNSGSFGTAGSFLSSDFFVFGLDAFGSAEALPAFAEGVPLVDLGVELEITLILGFLTESDRCGA
jgi:hypothetical protein